MRVLMLKDLKTKMKEKGLDEQARKTQLVVRHRLTELVLDILDEK